MEVPGILFLIIVITSSNTEEVKENLTGIKGGSITLPDPVLEHGFLSFGRKIIAMVIERKIQTYVDKVLWNNITGLFTITGLHRNDSGIYHIDSKTGRVFATSYKLTVYESVLTPAVNTLDVKSESCTLLCFVEKAEETTLLWYKDEETVNQSSSAFSLPLTVHTEDLSSSYRCVAANPAEEKTVLVDVRISCSGQNNTDNRAKSSTARVVIPIISAVIVILVACIIKCFNKNKRTTTQTQDSVRCEVQCADISEDRHRQTSTELAPMCGTNQSVRMLRGQLPDSSGPGDHSNLTTVYDKLEAHRMVDINTATT